MDPGKATVKGTKFSLACGMMKRGRADVIDSQKRTSVKFLISHSC
jgi:hypothetical protein